MRGVARSHSHKHPINSPGPGRCVISRFYTVPPKNDRVPCTRTDLSPTLPTTPLPLTRVTINSRRRARRASPISPGIHDSRVSHSKRPPRRIVSVKQTHGASRTTKLTSESSVTARNCTISCETLDASFRRGKKKRPFVSKLGCGLALSSTESIEPRHIASGSTRWGTL